MGCLAALLVAEPERPLFFSARDQVMGLGSLRDRLHLPAGHSSASLLHDFESILLADNRRRYGASASRHGRDESSNWVGCGGSAASRTVFISGSSYFFSKARKTPWSWLQKFPVNCLLLITVAALSYRLWSVP